MTIEAIRTVDAPAALGSYSQGTSVAGWVFTSGQIPLTPAGELIDDCAANAARQALDNISVILETAGASMADVVKVTLYLRDLADFPAVNDVYAEYFLGVLPARSCVAVSRLPRDALLEIDAVARRTQ